MNSISHLKSPLIPLLLFLVLVSYSAAASADALDDDLLLYEEEARIISDPLEPLNRVFFHFNDKFYFYLLNPVAKTYAAVFPDDIRTSFDNAFHNLLSPVRMVNNLLQGKLEASGLELTRFVINTTLGSVGLGDAAKSGFGLEAPADEDLGQTLGKYGVGEGLYFCWPFIGPSNVRDTIGFVGDAFLNPLTYVSLSDSQTGLAVQSGKRVNETSLKLGEYEDFKESSFDPYFALRDYYIQSRRSKIADKIDGQGQGARLIESDGFTEQLLAAEPFSAAEAVPNSPGPKKGYTVLPAMTSGTEKKFFVQVGAFIDPAKIESLVDKLSALELEAVVVEYNRADYNFYGVLVPGGDSFSIAKLEEQKLLNAGFVETIVVAH